MTDRQAPYPDISDILAQKAAGRIHNASISFGAKLDILEALKLRARPFIQARKARKAAQTDSHHETNSE
jgi:hypothetical protein